MHGDEDRDSDHDHHASTVSRLAHAVELIASAHAARAKEEAGKDLSRIGSGVLLLVVAALFAVPIILVLDAAAALYLVQRVALTLPVSLLSVGGFNFVIACAIALIARSRLAPPVMVETRATLKRAALVLRG